VLRICYMFLPTWHCRTVAVIRARVAFRGTAPFAGSGAHVPGGVEYVEAWPKAGSHCASRVGPCSRQLAGLPEVAVVTPDGNYVLVKELSRPQLF
jgi:hypothetical protein